MPQQTDNLKLNMWNMNDVVNFEEINDNFRKIDDALTWKILNDTWYKGDIEVELPEFFNELSIKINVSELGIITKLHVTRKELYENEQQEYRSGYHLTTNNGGTGCFLISKEKIKLLRAWLNGDFNGITEKTTWVVMYR